MKKARISLVAAALVLSTAISLATSTVQPAAGYCSSLPNGQGIIGTPASFGCVATGLYICCYEIPSNIALKRNW